MIPSICDLSDKYSELVQIATVEFRSFGGLRTFHGPITTLRCLEDNQLLRNTLKKSGMGRVMVVDGGGSLQCALVGDKLAGLMIQQGWAGVIVNGAVRDIENLRNMTVAVRALGVCPRMPEKLGVGECDINLAFAGITFRPGEYLYADENGFIVSPNPLH